MDLARSSVGNELTSTDCTLMALANRFASTGHLLSVTGGKVLIENNTFVSTDAFSDPLDIRSVVAGSRLAFNPVANFSGVDGTATVLLCDTSIDVTSNIFAWHSSATTPLTGCSAHDSLFDEFVPSNQVGSNHQAVVSTIFVDLGGRDLHLSATSPARSLGQPRIVDVDMDGNPRPDPPGSPPDVGAFESR